MAVIVSGGWAELVHLTAIQTASKPGPDILIWHHRTPKIRVETTARITANSIPATTFQTGCSVTIGSEKTDDEADYIDTYPECAHDDGKDFKTGHSGSPLFSFPTH